MKLNRDKDVLLEILPEDIDADGRFEVPHGVLATDSNILAGEAKKRLKIIQLNDVQRIGDNSFSFCKTLEAVFGYPRIIGPAAFFDCNRLSRFEFSKVQTIGNAAFYNTAFIEVDIRNIAVIPNGTFERCLLLERVIGSPLSVGSTAFYCCGQLKEFDFSNLQEIGRWAYYNCGLSQYMVEKEHSTEIQCGSFAATFARKDASGPSYRISGIIDANKGVYVDTVGNPFIFDLHGVRVSYRNNEEEFMKLWKQ